MLHNNIDCVLFELNCIHEFPELHFW